MESISDFVGAFRRDQDKYERLKEQAGRLYKDTLRGIEFLWQARVKSAQSLEKKLRDRQKNYENEADNVADIKDLVAERIILARWKDFGPVEEKVRQTFVLESRMQHPKQRPGAITLRQRFRGYDGLHLWVKLKDKSNDEDSNQVFEIQVVSAFMWTFQALHHDVIYKQLNGEPHDGLRRSLNLLQGIVNVGEEALE